LTLHGDVDSVGAGVNALFQPVFHRDWLSFDIYLADFRYIVPVV